LIDGGLSHLQYADDTIIFLKDNETNYENLKFLLLCYESMSGMKINYNKSEVFAIGIEQVEIDRIAAIFGCKVGAFPIIYLGLPVSDRKLSKNQLSFMEQKVANRLRSWKCDTLSSGGKAILLQSCLSSIPLYTMSVYLLYEGNYQQLNTLRSRFFWQGTRKKKKYHMVKWEALSRPKESGGLGFMDVRAMNVCLLSKWIDKLERGDESMCCELLRKKYLGQKSIFQIKTRSGSQF